MHIPRSILLLSLFLSSLSYADSSYSYAEKALRQNLHTRTQWKRFLYMEDNTSLVITRDFFVSENGAKDPANEMQAFVKALFAEASEDHVLCRFPARSKWLIAELKIPTSEFKAISCTEYEKFKTLVYPTSVWISFASYFLNTPASSYGHTLLRLSKSSKDQAERQNDLLDYSITLGANADTDNPIVYAVKGLLGGFSGNFAALPYYFKIREYNDYESRDLWSYSLNLTDADIERLVDLIWELDGAHFPYYYLTKNCSYYLLALLDAVNEDFHFVNEVPFYIIPIETVKALYKRLGFVHSVNYRASSRQQFWARYETLTPSEKEIYQNYVHLEQSGKPMLAYDQATRIHLLDLAITQYDYVYPTQIQNAKGPMYDNKREYLLARSQIPVASEPLVVNPKSGSEPHLGHSPGKYTYGLGILDTPAKYDRYGEFRLRFSFHELEDPPNGHFFSKLNMFDFKLRYYADGAPRVRLHKATFFDLFSVSPVNSFEHKASWQAEISFNDFIEPGCVHCYGARAAFAYGLSVEPLAEHKPTLYALAAGRLDAFQTPSNAIHYTPALGVKVGVWSHVFGTKDALEGEFSRFYISTAKHYGTEPFVSIASLLYSFDLPMKTRLHLYYELKNALNTYEIRLSQYM